MICTIGYYPLTRLFYVDFKLIILKKKRRVRNLLKMAIESLKEIDKNNFTVDLVR